MEDKKNYSDVHEELAEKLEKAYLEYTSEEYSEPEIDFSFMKTPPEPQEQRKKHTVSRFAKVAAAVIVVLLGGNMMLLLLNDSDSYGDKSLLGELHNKVAGIFEPSEEEESDDTEESISIDKADEISKAAEFLPELYIPGYMTQGYEFKTLDVIKYNSGDASAEYIYAGNEDREFNISLMYMSDDGASYSVQGDEELIELSDRSIMIQYDEVDKQYYVTVYTEICSISLSGMSDKEEAIRIAKGFYKSK